MSKVKSDNWGQSASGEVKVLVRQLRFFGFVRAVGRDMVLMTGFLAVLFAGYFYFRLMPETRYDLGDILCFEVQQVAKSFTSDSLDAETKLKVQEHLNHCPTCHRRLNGLLPHPWQRTQDVSATASPSSADKPAPSRSKSEG